MVRPFVLIHPTKEHVEQVDQHVLLKRKRVSVVLQLPYDLVRNIDYFGRFVGLPEGLTVFLLHKKSDVVDEAGQDLLFLPITPHYSEKITRHVLAGFCTVAVLILPIVVYFSIHYGLLELLHTIVVRNRLILIRILPKKESTLVGRRGLPRALSVLGLMSAPGGCIG